MNYSFDIDEDLLSALDEYHNKTMLMEKHIIEKKPYNGNLENDVNDDLIFNVPIYDMGSRKYAAFCSFTEAIMKKELDPKGNGFYFKEHDINNEFDLIMMFYLFRLCGSGINYRPKINCSSIDDILGTHGFGNFWIINSILKNRYTYLEWFNDLKNTSKPFTDNKGYLLPQFTFINTNQHLKKFILEYSEKLIKPLYEFITKEKREIYQVTDYGNNLLKSMGFKRQNFVLTATAADIGEYFPNYVDKSGMTYAGTNAVKCIKTIFKKRKKISEFEYINDVLRFQSNRYNLNPIDCEDSRNCDVIRYFMEYQSRYHIEKNNGTIMKNNSVLKKVWGIKKYNAFKENLK